MIRTRVERYKKEEVIYLEDKVDENIYMVSDGKVKLINYDGQGNEIVRQILTKGELFGEKVILGEAKRNEFAIACQSNTSVCRMDLPTMRDLMRKNEKFSVTIYRLIGLRIKKIERRLDLLVGKDVTARIACFIYDSAKETNSKILKNQLSQKDIASLLATSRESVAKVFNKMKEEGVIDYSRKEIKIKDMDALVKLSRE